MSPTHNPDVCNMFYATEHNDPTQNTAPLITSGTTTTLATPTSATPTRNVTAQIGSKIAKTILFTCSQLKNKVIS